MSVLRKMALGLTAGVLCWSFPAYAVVQECPEGSDAFENQETGSLLCVVLEGEDAGLIVSPIVREDDDVAAPETGSYEGQDGFALDDPSIVYIDPVEYTAEELRESHGIIAEYYETEAILRSLAEGGFILEGGIGWGVPAALDLRFSMGYMFASPNMESGFSLSLDFYGLIKIPSYISLSIVPAYYFISGSFRMTTGLGFGFLHYFMHFQTGDPAAKDLIEHGDDQNTFFIIKPTLLFDWFVTEDVFVGIGLEGAISVEMQPDDKFHPHFNVFFHSGYKF